MPNKVVYERRRTKPPAAWKLTSIAYPQHAETFEEWASLAHLKESTLDVLRTNEIDDLSTVRLLNTEDIKKLPIKLGQAKLLEYAVKKLKRSDASLNTSKETSYSRGSSPDRTKSDSFYIVPSPTKGRKSPTRFSQVDVDDITPEDPENSPCTIRITIETKKDEEMEPEETSYIEEIVNPSKNLLSELEEEQEEIPDPQAAPVEFAFPAINVYVEGPDTPDTSDTDAEKEEPHTEWGSEDGWSSCRHDSDDEGGRRSRGPREEVASEHVITASEHVITAPDEDDDEQRTLVEDYEPEDPYQEEPMEPPSVGASGEKSTLIGEDGEKAALVEETVEQSLIVEEISFQNSLKVCAQKVQKELIESIERKALLDAAEEAADEMSEEHSDEENNEEDSDDENNEEDNGNKKISTELGMNKEMEPDECDYEGDEDAEIDKDQCREDEECEKENFEEEECDGGECDKECGEDECSGDDKICDGAEDVTEEAKEEKEEETKEEDPSAPAAPQEGEEGGKEEEEHVAEEETPAGELDETVTDMELEVKGEAILPPPPPPIEVSPEVNRMTLEIEATETDLQTPVLVTADRRALFIPCMESLANRREELIKHAARRIVAESMSDQRGQDDEYTRDKLVAFLEGAYGTTLIRLSNDQGTLKFLVPQLSEQAVQTEEDKEDQEAEAAAAAAQEDAEAAKEEDPGADNKDLDSISGELSTPLCDDADLPPPAECDEDRDRMPDPPQIEEPGDAQRPADRKESLAYDPEKDPNAIPNFHIPSAVNKFGNYTQVQMLGEDLQHHPSTRRPMSPVVSQPIRWECNRSQKGSSPPRITKGTPNKNTSPVRHRTPSPQRFRSPDRAARVRVSNGMPAGTAYKASGEIDPKIKQSPPKDIVTNIRSQIESPSRGSPPKPRSPSPVKPFDTDAFKLARKLAQEVADCPPDCIMVRVRDLQRCPKALLPAELDKSHLEDYISDTEFRRTLGLSRAEFDTFSEWKQQEMKKELGLF